MRQRPTALLGLLLAEFFCWLGSQRHGLACGRSARGRPPHLARRSLRGRPGGMDRRNLQPGQTGTGQEPRLGSLLSSCHDGSAVGTRVGETCGPVAPLRGTPTTSAATAKGKAFRAPPWRESSPASRERPRPKGRKLRVQSRHRSVTGRRALSCSTAVPGGDRAMAGLPPAPAPREPACPDGRSSAPHDADQLPQAGPGGRGPGHRGLGGLGFRGCRRSSPNASCSQRARVRLPRDRQAAPRRGSAQGLCREPSQVREHAGRPPGVEPGRPGGTNGRHQVRHPRSHRLGERWRNGACHRAAEPGNSF